MTPFMRDHTRTEYWAALHRALYRRKVMGMTRLNMVWDDLLRRHGLWG
jgi:hypothetical protein